MSSPSYRYSWQSLLGSAFGAVAACVVLALWWTSSTDSETFSAASEELILSDSASSRVHVVPSRGLPAHPATTESGELLLPPPSLQARDIISSESPQGFSARILALAAFDRALTPSEFNELCAFVAETGTPERWQPSQILALKNDVLNVLQKQTSHREKLRQVLTEIYRNPSHEPALRDYALQHLAALELAVNNEQRSTVPPPLIAQWEAARGADPALAATAMLHLAAAHRRLGLSRSQQQDLAKLAMSLASNGEIAPASRGTALHVARAVNATGVGELAFGLASLDETPDSLRVSAIAVLGDLAPASVETRSVLTGLAENGSRRLRIPAQAALERLNAAGPTM